ncbi:2-C-methyl-D-erythritol 4-phosphate cytidylyltransferase [Oceanicoccus sp. KOV_DT_Chl]|uniref:2-C-methyl-D-erythritol 4-phosphate cytidylyltransferase n=1 Tax=Oceanicoccus sp. KOV_DT_Chl TaxID=1904639 RepID=UPI000C7D1D3F|nr:2-C-methyl-D-erythritol 4-phosphate cytidylyltransferase [Oceanicoccus sp. KOV_DT_Chl]
MTVKSTSNVFYAVVPAAGVGRRMGTDQPKQYLPLLDKLVIEHTLSRLLAEPRLRQIVVAVAAQDTLWPTLEILKHPRISVVVGGAERSDSVLSGLQSLAQVCSAQDWVLVHDVARPCLSVTDISRLIDHLSEDPVGGILAVPASDTLKKVNGQAEVSHTIDRQAIWQAQTPQMFRYQLLLDALVDAVQQGLLITDEASAIEMAGLSGKVVEALYPNPKITRPNDLALAEFYLQRGAIV